MQDFSMPLRRRVLIGAIATLSILGCSLNTGAQDKTAMKQPSEIAQRFTSAKANGLAETADAQALYAQVSAYIDGRYQIIDAAFYQESASVPWAGVSQYVASARAAGRQIPPGGGKPAFETWHRMSELTDVYPADAAYSAFAVAMAKESLPDGSKLVGYFVLESVK
jgi:hypothetical protein